MELLSKLSHAKRQHKTWVLVGWTIKDNWTITILNQYLTQNQTDVGTMGHT